MSTTQRLSESVLWTLQRRYFEHAGIDAWRRQIVPQYITTNPVVADAMARLAVAMLGDWSAAHALDARAPIYVVELGAGAGQFGYRCVQRLNALLHASPLRELRVVYVMTDISAKTLGYWQAHPRLEPLVVGGLLDFAFFDATAPQAMRLEYADELLTPDRIRNPLVVIATYVLDSLPQDCFGVEHGQLYEHRLAVPRTEEQAESVTLNDLRVAWERHPVDSNYFADATANRILRTYQHSLERTTLLFPTCALACIAYLRSMAHGRLGLLVADKGYHAEAELDGRPDPTITRHGSVSLMVNYHALGEYVRLTGGLVLHPLRGALRLALGAYVYGAPEAGCPATAQAYDDAVINWSPDDFFVLKKGVEAHYAEMTLDQLLAFLRLSRWDAHVLAACLPYLVSQMAGAGPAEREVLRAGAHQAWATYLPIGEAEDVAFAVGVVLYGLGWPAEALVLFEQSLRLAGQDPSTTYNMAMCHTELGNKRAAREWLARTARLDPEFELLSEHDAAKS